MDIIYLPKKSGFRNINIIPFDWLHPSIPEKYINHGNKKSLVIEKIPILLAFSGSLLFEADE